MPQIQQGNVLAFYGRDSIFSNHYLMCFRVKGLTFICVEQLMMYSKAQLFKDTETAIRIMDSTDPVEMKRLGRNVRNFDDKIWEERRVGIVTAGVFAKFNQNKEAARELLQTKDLILAEGSANDLVYGVGLRVTDPKIGNPEKWLGFNLMGIILMDVREQLKRSNNCDDVPTPELSSRIRALCGDLAGRLERTGVPLYSTASQPG